MPQRAARPCSQPGCPALVHVGRYCLQHQRERQVAANVVRDRYEQRTQRGTAAERGYDAGWQEISKRYLAAHPWCQRCGQRAVLVHHRVPIAQGGTNDESNLASSCQSCHNKVHGR
jgi:5-methylcytosine-specific restriction protein A